MRSLYKGTARNLANAGFVCGTFVVAAGIYLLLRGEPADGAAAISSGILLSVVGAYELIRLDTKVQ